MSSKKGNGKVSSEKKKRMMSIEMKQEIIGKHERGLRVSDLAKLYDRSSSTICTILKQKDAIKAIKPTKGVTIISKLRTDTHDEMERLLLLWIRDKELVGDTVTESIISEKALSIYKNLQREAASTEGETSSGTRGIDFKASHGWFEKFKKRTGIHFLVRHGQKQRVEITVVFCLIII